MQTKPKYRLLADHIAAQIQNGDLGVGSFLPTEAELMQQYDVSRHTVRAALQDLRSRGLVRSRQGQGTEVLSPTEDSGFVERLQTIEELISLGQATRIEMIDSTMVELDQEAANLLQQSEGKSFLQARFFRHAADTSSETSQDPLSLTTIWLPMLFSEAKHVLDKALLPVSLNIANHFGFELKEVRQRISAQCLDKDLAARFKVKQGSAALSIIRHYHRDDGEIFLHSHTICPADRYQLESRFRS